jgi:hypothetical protein
MVGIETNPIEFGYYIFGVVGLFIAIGFSQRIQGRYDHLVLTNLMDCCG